jgi:inosine/xanthosine triphosphatase
LNALVIFAIIILMKTILVASHNPVKIQAALNGFQKMFPGEQFEMQGISVPSGVSDQPMTSAETLQGALNRARGAAQQPADYWVGLEGGCEAMQSEMQAFAWVVVLSKDRIGKSRTGTFTLPDEITRLVRQGVELGEADDRVFNRSNSKQNNGAVGILTDDVIDRTAYYEQAVILALIPFKNPNLSFETVE